MNGFIYIMSNPVFKDGRIKIGKSKSDPSSWRLNELYTTGVPEPFKLEYSAFTENYDFVETKVHKILDEFRPNKSREFFIVSIPKAITIIRENSKIELEKIIYKSPKEIDEEKNKVEKERILEEQKIKNQKRIDEIKKNKEIQHENYIREIDLQRENYIKERIKPAYNWKYIFADKFFYISITLMISLGVSGINYIENQGLQNPIFFILFISIFYFFYKKEKKLKEKYSLLAQQKYPYPNYEKNTL